MSDWGDGVKGMARSCQSALKLVRDGEWTLADFERWLQLVIQPTEDETKKFLVEMFPGRKE